MRRLLRIASCTLALAGFVLFTAPARATDIDGPDDCAKPSEDWGDAPECIPAYGPAGPPAQFPTCSGSCGVGTQELFCGPPLSTPPGPTGFVHHTMFPGSPGPFWLGCYLIPGGPLGIDTDPDGKTSNPAGPSSCAPIPTDCAEPAFGTVFGQDECYGDGSDAGITAPLSFVACTGNAVPFNAWYCGPQQQLPVFLNILVDWTGDSDWNDNASCAGACAPEWAVKNVPIALTPGCNALTSPAFPAGPRIGHAWMRISLTFTPVSDDYPWAGSANEPGGLFRDGETEDYPVDIQGATPARLSSWGGIKGIYR
jgi:hypothetical protein